MGAGLPLSLVGLPLVGAVLVGLLPPGLQRHGRTFALAHMAALAGLALAGVLYAPDGGSGWFGFDPLTRAMVLLSVAVFGMAFAAADRVSRRPHIFHAWLLALTGATLGVFLAQNWAVVYACWEATLVPLFFLVGLWGGAGRARAAMVLVVFTLVGSAFLLVAVLALPGLLGDLAPAGPLTLAAFAEVGPRLAPGTQTLLLAAFLVGVGVKLPIFPLHPWLPLAHVQASTPVTITLSGILTKMAAYMLLRLAVALPEGFATLAPVLAVLGAVALIHGAVLAARRTDLKAALAWSTLAHMGLVLVAISTLEEVGIEGAVLEMFAHGLTAAAAFYAVGRLYEATGSRDVRDHGGLLARHPGWGLALGLALLATMAFPGTAGFAAEVQIVSAVWRRFGWAVVPVVGGALLWSAVVVRLLVRLLSDAPTTAPRPLAPPAAIDRWALGGALAVAVVLGLMPGRATAPLRPSVMPARPVAAAPAPAAVVSQLEIPPEAPEEATDDR